MDHFKRLSVQIRNYLFLVFFVSNILVAAAVWLAVQRFAITSWPLVALIVIVVVLVAGVSAVLMTPIITEPIRFLRQAILHVLPSHSGTAAPNLEQSHIGRELVTSLSLQVYQLASSAPLPTAKESIGMNNSANNIANHVPLPLIVIDKSSLIQFVNEAACTYLQLPMNELIQKNIYSVLDLSFQSEQTLDKWLVDCRSNKVTASKSWERVRLKVANLTAPLQFDMAAYYSKDDPSGAETILALFDHSERYRQDDEAASYIALAVHELRTPLTILRGYIEVFEDELVNQLNPEMADFMKKMQASAESLAAFVNNILNVARVDENQLTLELQSESWSDIVNSAVADMQLRAQVHDKIIQAEIATDLPAVAVDRVSIYEVLNNLLDNAIKYSGQAKQIVVKARLGQDGMVETTVQDFGVGVPESVIPNLFDKFYRSHRSRAQIGGTGLGLYLSKAIVKAHGGQIWVRSKEGQGSVFGFALVPFDKLAEQQKNSDNKDIVRGAHGWIKNHSLYRR